MERRVLNKLRLDKGQIEVLDDKVAAVIKKKSGQERLKMVWEAWVFFDKSIRYYLKNLHPDWTDQQIQMEIIKRVSYGTK